MVLIFFSRCHVFYPLFHLSGLPFSFFCKQSHFFSFINIFHSFSPFFYPSSPFHTIFLPFTASPSRFYSFRSCLYYIFPFSVVFCLFSTHFYLFCFFRLFHRFTPSFCHFFRSSFIFSLLLMSLSPSHFSRFTSLKMFHVKHRFLRFSIFGDQWEAICFPAFRKSLSFFTSLIFKIIVFSILFWFSPSFLHFSCISACFTQFFVSVFSLLLNYLIIFLYFRINWTFTFVFSDFPNHLLNAFWDHFFMDFYQSGRILSHSAVFMLLCVLLHHFFSVFLQLCKPFKYAIRQ